jgi:hypothetical protein
VHLSDDGQSISVDSLLPFAPGLRGSPKSAPFEGNLQRLIDAWPTLPLTIRLSVLALVETAVPESQ